MALEINTEWSSPNFNGRGGKAITALCLHTTEGWWDSDLEWLCSAASGVSCHYVISPAGEIFQIVKDLDRAWHAGAGYWNGCSDLNTISIGIELSHVDGHPYDPAQWAACDELSRMLISRYPIQQHMVCAHRWYAPDRRSDPTDISDPELHAWIAGLYDVHGWWMNATVDLVNVREGPGTQYPVALGGLAQLAPGQVFEVDDHTPSDDPTHPENWLHSSLGIGFAYSPLCAPVLEP